MQMNIPPAHASFNSGATGLFQAPDMGNYRPPAASAPVQSGPGEFTRVLMGPQGGGGGGSTAPQATPPPAPGAVPLPPPPKQSKMMTVMMGVLACLVIVLVIVVIVLALKK